VSAARLLVHPPRERRGAAIMNCPIRLPARRAVAIEDALSGRSSLAIGKVSLVAQDYRSSAQVVVALADRDLRFVIDAGFTIAG